MINVSVARRYARALLEAESESGASEELLKAMGTWVSLLSSHPELENVFTNPAHNRAVRVAVAIEIINQMDNVHPLFKNLVQLLIERHRMADLPNIARLFRDMVDARAGRVRGRLTTAAPVGEEPVEVLQQALERMTQKKVLLERQVDPSVIGGALAQVGSITYDGTLRNELNRIRRSLKSS